MLSCPVPGGISGASRIGGVGGGREETDPPPMREWEQEVRNRIAKDDKFKPLAAKYPLVLLHAVYPRRGAYGHSAFSFIYETSDKEKHFNNVQFVWGNGGIKNQHQNLFETNMLNNQQNVVVDLGKVDFEKDSEHRPHHNRPP